LDGRSLQDVGGAQRSGGGEISSRAPLGLRRAKARADAIVHYCNAVKGFTMAGWVQGGAVLRSRMIGGSRMKGSTIWEVKEQTER